MKRMNKYGTRAVLTMDGELVKVGDRLTDFRGETAYFVWAHPYKNKIYTVTSLAEVREYEKTSLGSSEYYPSVFDLTMGEPL